MSSHYLFYRSLHSFLLLFLATIVVFLILHLTPGDPALIILGGQATPETIQDLRRAWGLDKPLPEQYVRYMSRLLRGDLGVSIRAQRPVIAYVGERIPATLELVAAAILLALMFGLPLGIVAAVKRHSATDYLAMTFSLLGQCVPSFWLGLMLIVIFAVMLKVLPSSGRGGVAHLIMPAFTLAFYYMALIARLTRAGMLEVLNQDYIRTARAKGLIERLVITKHALKNSLLPLITVLGVQIGTLLGGAVVTETVFSWPGIGSLAVTAIFQRDYPIVQGVVLLSSAIFVFVNFTVDVLYLYLDPRISYA